ncbi:MAG: hypothetical protein AAGK98_14455 [Pseudomonadota bacterium]
MDGSILIDAARYAHLATLAAGIGMAALADQNVLRALHGPLAPFDLALLHRLHRAMIPVLVAIWTTGIVLLDLRTDLQPSEITPKLWAKLAVVTILTLNAWAIGRLALPALEDLGRMRFGDLPASRRMLLAGLGGISAASWLSALALGCFAGLRDLGGQELLTLFGLIYGASLYGAVVVALAARLVGEEWFVRPASRRA